MWALYVSLIFYRYSFWSKARDLLHDVTVAVGCGIPHPISLTEQMLKRCWLMTPPRRRQLGNTCHPTPMSAWTATTFISHDDYVNNSHAIAINPNLWFFCYFHDTCLIEIFQYLPQPWRVLMPNEPLWNMFDAMMTCRITDQRFFHWNKRRSSWSVR